MRTVSTAITMLALTALSTPALAGVTPVPEPGVLELAGIGVAVAIAVGLAKKRRK